MCELILKDGHILPGCRHTRVHAHALAGLSQPDRQSQPFCSCSVWTLPLCTAFYPSVQL